MKKYGVGIWMVLLGVGLLTPNLFGQADKKGDKDKKEVLDSLYSRVCTEGYRIDIDRATTASMPNTERFNPRGFITVADSTVKTQLPFFGKMYSAPYGAGSGIEAEGVVENKKVERKKREVEVRFDVRDKNEYYQFYIQLFPGGNASVRLNSNQREGISYYGTYEFFNANNKKSD